jgi:hypothetical protein
MSPAAPHSLAIDTARFRAGKRRVRLGSMARDEGRTCSHPQRENLSAFLTIHPDPMTD